MTPCKKNLSNICTLLNEQGGLLTHCVEDNAQSRAGNRTNRRVLSQILLNSKQVMLVHRYCGILGFCSDQEWGFGEKCGRRLGVQTKIRGRALWPGNTRAGSSRQRLVASGPTAGHPHVQRILSRQRHGVRARSGAGAEQVTNMAEEHSATFVQIHVKKPTPRASLTRSRMRRSSEQAAMTMTMTLREVHPTVVRGLALQA